MECHWLERQNCFAGSVHRFDLLFVPSRGTYRAELVRRVDHHRYGVGVLCCDIANLPDKAAVAHLSSYASDGNNAIGRRYASSGTGTQSDVAAPSYVATERTRANRRIVGAVGAKQRINTNDRV